MASRYRDTAGSGIPRIHGSESEIPAQDTGEIQAEDPQNTRQGEGSYNNKYTYA